MRHRKGYRKLSKATDQRKAMLRAMSLGLIKSGKIVTSKDRAKETRKVVEKIIALAKKGGLINLRKALAVLPNKTEVTEFFKAAPERFKGNAGGATRLTGMASRRGDNADMVTLEFVA